MAYLSCLHTVIRNMSGSKTYFGFLPPHGVTLGVGQEYTIRGDLVTRIADQKDQDRSWPSFQNALDSAQFVIIQSPSIYYYDPVSDSVQTVQIKNRVVGVVEPCWGWYSDAGGTSHAG